MRSHSSALILVAMAAMLAAGYFLGLRQREGRASGAVPVASARPVSAAPAGSTNEIAQLHRDIERLRRLYAQEKRMTAEFEAQVAQLQLDLAAARQSAAVAASAPARPSPPSPQTVTPPQSRPATVLNAAGVLDDAFVQAEGLTEEGRAKIDRLLADARQQWRALELKHAEVKYAADNELIIAVKPFVEEGRAVEEALTQSLAGVLKTEAAERLRQALLNPLGSVACNTGAGSRDLTIKTETADDGRPLYTIRDSGNRGGGGARQPSAVTMSFGGAGGASVATGMNVDGMQMLSTSSPQSGSYTRTLRTRSIPEQYAHFLADDKQ